MKGPYMKEKFKNIKKYLDVLKPVVYFIGIHLLVVVVSMIVISIYFKDYNYDLDEISDIKYYMLVIVHCISIFVYYKWYRKLMKGSDTLHKKVSFKDKIVITLYGLGVILICDGIMYTILKLIMRYSPNLLDEYFKTNQVNSNTLIIYFICLVITGPLAEELMLRGVILSKAKKVMPFYLANILQSFLFALFHFDLLNFISFFLVGLLLGYITRVYGSIKPAIFTHALNNSISFILPYILDNSQVSLIDLPIAFWILITLVGACFVFIFIYKTREKDNIWCQY